MAKQRKALKKYAKKHLAETIAKRKMLRPVIQQMKERGEKKKEKSHMIFQKASEEHKKDLEDIEKHDREFVEYLEAEEPELLNFGKLDDVSSEEDVEDDIQEDLSADKSLLSTSEIDQIMEEAFGVKVSCSDDHWLSYSQSEGRATSHQLRQVLVAHRKIISQLTLDGTFDQRSYFAAANKQIIKYFPLAIKSLHTQAYESTKKQSGSSMQKPHDKKISDFSEKIAKMPLNASAEGLWRKFLHNVALYSKSLLKAGCKLSSEMLNDEIMPYLFDGVTAFSVLSYSCTKAYKIVLSLAIRCICAEDKTEYARLSAIRFVKRSISLAKGNDMSVDKIFKKLFVYLIDVAQKCTEKFLATSALMISDIVALYGENHLIAYQTVFLCLKKLSHFVRKALLSSVDAKAKASLVNWQSIVAIKLISGVIIKHHTEAELGSLTYPLIQVSLGALEVANSPSYIPFQFQIIEIILKISKAINCNVPVTPYFLRFLKYSIFSKKTITDHTDKSLAEFSSQLPLLLHLDRNKAKIGLVQLALFEKFIQLTAEYASIFAYSISFPESLSILHQSLKKANKSMNVVAHSRLLSRYLRSVNLTEEIIQERRKAVTLSPTNTEHCQIWEAKFRDEVPSLPLLDFLSE